jgi:hypothetical protein
MTKQKSYLTLSHATILPANTLQEANRLFPAEDIADKLSFLNDMKEGERKKLVSDMQYAAGARLLVSRSKLALGKYIAAIKEDCGHYDGSFEKAMKYLKINLRMAYRYMSGFTNVDQAWHENLVTAAIIKGLNFVSVDEDHPFGKYTEAVRLLPTPSNPDMETATRYLEQLEETRRELNTKRKTLQAAGKNVPPPITDTKKDPELLKERAYRGIKYGLTFVSKRQRQAWFEEVVGMAMTKAGYSSATTFSPMAVPDEYDAGPGRPRGRQIEA